MLALIAAMTGCDSGQRPVSVSKTANNCPVTGPSGKPPFPGAYFNYGDRYLGVGLWPKGRLVTGRLPDGSRWAELKPDGSVVAKLGWRRGAAGRLTIHGERLDAPAPPLRARVPDGYGNTGFQSTQLTFPTRGCWKVVGSVAEHDITFVVLVTMKTPARSSSPRLTSASGASMGEVEFGIRGSRVADWCAMSAPARRSSAAVRSGGARACCRDAARDGQLVANWVDVFSELSNLVLLCRHHHRLLHEGGYRVERLPGGALSFRRPDGRRIDSGARRTRGDRHEILRRHRRKGLRIGPETPIALSGGGRFSLDLAVEGLLERGVSAETA